MALRKDESPTRRRKSSASVRRCVILNPGAGSVKGLADVHQQLERLNAEKVLETKKAGDAERLAKAAARAGFGEIIAAGGDGTLNQVINGLAGSFDKVRVGLLPLGTGNDFARSLNLPATLEENVDLVLAARTMSVDVVRVKTRRVRHFINVSTGGFSGEVNEKLTPEIKRTWGSLAYVRSAAAALPALQGYCTTVTLDDREDISLDLFNVAVANGRYVAGGLPIAPEADLRDGLLDVILIPKQSATDTVVLAAQIVLGKHLSSSMVVARRAKKLSVRSRPGMWFNVDGELVGNQPAMFSVLPRALNFLVGK